MAARWIDKRADPTAKAKLAAERSAVAEEELRMMLGHPPRGAPFNRETLSVRPKDRSYLPPPPPPADVAGELARLADGTPQLWTSSIRSQLLRDGLIEITSDGSGRWMGDKITHLGRAKLRLGDRIKTGL